MCLLLPFPSLRCLLQVGMATGATIHTANGMQCTVERRVPAASPAAPEPALAS